MWLVTGGAGYIGAHVVRRLISAGYGVRVLDDLSTGDARRLPPEVELKVGRIDDRWAVRDALADVDGVIHLAARKDVAESVARPLWYHSENVTGLALLLDEVGRASVERFVFSSSAAVYGECEGTAIQEAHACAPLNPYGRTKLVGEWLVADMCRTSALQTTALRYFNVVGCDGPHLGDRGQANLVPMVFARIEAGMSPRIFGGDYPTADGTCVRDFVHVGDLADAHVAAVAELLRRPPSPDPATFNVGTGTGYSVRAVIDAVSRVSGSSRQPIYEARRPGDAAHVVADPALIRQRLGWRSTHDLEDMVASAWAGWNWISGEPGA